MAVFEYQGFDSGGKAVKGIIDAEGVKSARSKLRKQGVFPTDIDEQSSGRGATKGKGLNVEIDFGKLFGGGVSVGQISTMTSQLSTLVGAGIPMVESLTAMIDQVDNESLRIILAEVRDKVNEGDSLAKAMKGYPHVFGDLYINMVSAGETSGALDVVLQRLTEYTEASVKLRGKIISAMIYPVLMSFVGIAIVGGLFIFVIPKIRKIFDSFGADLPFVTDVLLGISDFASAWWWTALFIVPGTYYGYWRWKKKPENLEKRDRFILWLPLFGRITRIVAVSRFCRTMSTLLASGVPILTAMTIVARVVENKVIEKAVNDAARNVTEGQSLAVPLKASGQFPPMVTHMIAIGERTGDLEPMLEKVADAYEQEVDNTVNALTSLLEPILIIGMGGVVAFVALAILLPMLNLSSLSG
ncbi:MAG: type II secretion system inner membrane protein GspF [Proteobacteria bacterium]|nr:type II secretion system inner membrane protein GspF [Pseudomonadota bacterium]MCP4916475.1 type II secretion system inner membrane protein GspF [Pseudomonadota bacterium]